MNNRTRRGRKELAAKEIRRRKAEGGTNMEKRDHALEVSRDVTAILRDNPSNRGAKRSTHARFSVAIVLSGLFIGLPGTIFLRDYWLPYWRFGYDRAVVENIRTVRSYETRVVRYSNGVRESLYSETYRGFHFSMMLLFPVLTFSAVLVEYVLIRMVFGFSIFNDLK